MNDVLVLSYYVSLLSEFRVVVSATSYEFRIKTMFCSPLLPVVCRRARVLFMIFVFVYDLWYPTHILLWLCFVCIRLFYSMFYSGLSIFDCPFCIL